MSNERRADLCEIELKVAVEMRAVRLLAGKRREAVNHESARPEEIGEHRRQRSDWRGEIERILLRVSSWHSRKQTHSAQRDQSSHRSPRYRISVMIQVLPERDNV